MGGIPCSGQASELRNIPLSPITPHAWAVGSLGLSLEAQRGRGSESRSLGIGEGPSRLKSGVPSSWA